VSDAPTPGTTISCQEVVELVTDYLEDDLDPAVRTELEAHLALCEGCDTYVEQLRETIRRLGRVRAENLSPRAQEDLLSAFRTFRAGRGTGGGSQ
jgi:anti-sigma factor RsiW